MSHVLNLEQAEQFVSRNQPGSRPKASAQWEGWDMILTFPSYFAEKDTNGVFMKTGGYWAIAKRVSPDSSGNYRFSWKGRR